MEKLLVIGANNCGACMMTKKKLQDAQIEFEYVVNTDLPETEWTGYRKKAIASGQMSMPIIFKGEELVTLDMILEGK